MELLGKVERDCSLSIQRVVNFGADFGEERGGGGGGGGGGGCGRVCVNWCQLAFEGRSLILLIFSLLCHLYRSGSLQ